MTIMIKTLVHYQRKRPKKVFLGRQKSLLKDAVVRYRCGSAFCFISRLCPAEKKYVNSILVPGKPKKNDSERQYTDSTGSAKKLLLILKYFVIRNS